MGDPFSALDMQRLRDEAIQRQQDAARYNLFREQAGLIPLDGQAKEARDNILEQRLRENHYWGKRGIASEEFGKPEKESFREELQQEVNEWLGG